MSEDHFDVGVIVARRKLKGPWADHAWLPHAVLPAAPATAPWTSLGRDGEDELFYAGAFEVRLHPSETAHYRDNLASGRPSLWVSLRPLAGAIGETIEAVPMPVEIQAKVAAFFEAFHVERPFIKRKRDRADPEALAQRRRDRGRGDDE